MLIVGFSVVLLLWLLKLCFQLTSNRQFDVSFYLNPQMRFNLRRSFPLLTTKASFLIHHSVYWRLILALPNFYALPFVRPAIFDSEQMPYKLFHVLCFHIILHALLNLIRRKYFGEVWLKNFCGLSVGQQVPR